MVVEYHEEVRSFILTLERQTQSKVIRGLDLLEQYGLNVGFPHVKKLTKLLYELRIRGRQEVRIFFVVQQTRALLVHGFVKKSQKIPQREIQVAERRYTSLTTI